MNIFKKISSIELINRNLIGILICKIIIDFIMNTYKVLQHPTKDLKAVKTGFAWLAIPFVTCLPFFQHGSYFVDSGKFLLPIFLQYLYWQVLIMNSMDILDFLTFQLQMDFRYYYNY